MFVSLVEEGLIDKEVTRLVVSEYLRTFKDSVIDSLLLGCTHYPMLKEAIGDFLGKDITLIDSTVSCAREVERILNDLNLKAQPDPDTPAKHSYFVTDMPRRFMELGGTFLETEIKKVTVVENLED